MKKRAYVGVTKELEREVFMSATIPTNESHGSTYAYAVGPFYTKADAEYYVTHKLYSAAVVLLPSQVHKMRKAAALEA